MEITVETLARAMAVAYEPDLDWDNEAETDLLDRETLRESASKVLAALEAFLPTDETEMVEWGVRVGTWPTPTTYQTRELAEYYTDHPFKGKEEYEHQLVTRRVRSTPWSPVTREAQEPKP